MILVVGLEYGKLFDVGWCQTRSFFVLNLLSHIVHMSLQVCELVLVEVRLNFPLLDLQFKPVHVLKNIVQRHLRKFWIYRLLELVHLLLVLEIILLDNLNKPFIVSKSLPLLVFNLLHQVVNRRFQLLILLLQLAYLPSLLLRPFLLHWSLLG